MPTACRVRFISRPNMSDEQFARLWHSYPTTVEFARKVGIDQRYAFRRQAALRAKGVVLDRGTNKLAKTP